MSVLDQIARGLDIDPAGEFVQGRLAANQQETGELRNMLLGQEFQAREQGMQAAQGQAQAQAAARAQLAELAPILAQQVPQVMGDDPRGPLVQQGIAQFAEPNGDPAIFASAWKTLMESQGGAGSKLISGEQAEGMGFIPGTVIEKTGSGAFEVLQSGQRPETAAQRANRVLRQRADSRAEARDQRAEQAALERKVPGAVADSRAFLIRMNETTKLIDEIEAKPEFNPANTGGRFVSSIPVVGQFMTSEDRQKYNQAAQNWIRANLRKESGAVIGEQEMKDEYATYFPLAGDKPALVKQKRQARKLAEQAMKARAQLDKTQGPPPPQGFVED